MAILYVYHQRYFSESVINEDDVQLTSSPLRMRYVFWIDGKPHSPAQINAANICTAIA